MGAAELSLFASEGQQVAHDFPQDKSPNIGFSRFLDLLPIHRGGHTRFSFEGCRHVFVVLKAGPLGNFMHGQFGFGQKLLNAIHANPLNFLVGGVPQPMLKPFLKSSA